MVRDGSIIGWLEALKGGYGKRFAGAFEELGVEDMSDLAEMVDSICDTALKQALEAKGAKTVQVQKIQQAIRDAVAVQLPVRGGVGTKLTAPASAPTPRGRPTSRTSSGWRPSPPREDEADVPGLRVLHAGDGPRIYMVHGIDGDISGAGYSYRGIAPHLAPCHSSALVFDEEALACDSIPSLALLYNQRIMADAVRHPHARIIIAGYSLGCAVAHQMALQFQDNFTEVDLVLFGFEVTWPPAPSLRRVGGYDWLGGDVEATLLVARSLPGGQEWATAEAQALLRLPRDARNPEDVQRRAFSEVVAMARRSSRQADFQSYVTRAGRNMDALRGMTHGAFAPPTAFAGKALLVLAPESPESSTPARLANAKHCDSLEVVYGSGTHFNMLQAEQARFAARGVISFLREVGHLSTDAEADNLWF